MIQSVRTTAFGFLLFLACLGWPSRAEAGQPPVDTGTFRFLTQSLPDGTTNAVYTATLLVANAKGTVTFSSNPSPPFPGVTLDAATGLITGRPTVVDASGFNVTFSANDGTSTIQLTVKIRITASGGGGNAGVNFVTTALPSGRVGVAYSATITVQNNVGTVILGATDLPAGLSLNGLTGALSGTPVAAGTFYVTFSATDQGDGNKVSTVIALLILPGGTSAFQFTTTILNNGEVGTPYSFTVTTSGGGNGQKFSASGLPPGLTISQNDGVISGTPTVAGTYLVIVTATDQGTVITLNRPLWIAPSATSSFIWDFISIPAAIVNVLYTRQPDIVVAAANGATVTYSASGLPAGILYDPNTGALTGTAEEIGIYPVIFTATDSSGAVLTFAFDFVVLPPNGGDTNSLPINLWVKKQSIKYSKGNDGAWKAQYIYNADRRTGRAFDPNTQDFSVAIGSRTLTIAKTKFVVSGGKFTFKSASGATPKEQVKVTPKSQTFTVATGADTIPDKPPGVLRNAAVLGNKGYKLDEFFNDKGAFIPALAYRKTAFVCATAKIKSVGSGMDQAAFALLLGDPSFTFVAGTSVMRFRMLLGTTVLVDKTFTTLVVSKESTIVNPADASGTIKIFKLKGIKDTAATDLLGKFSYDSKSGKMALALKNSNLAALTGTEAHVTLELTVGDKTYITAVTLFAPKPGAYSTKMP